MKYLLVVFLCAVAFGKTCHRPGVRSILWEKEAVLTGPSSFVPDFSSFVNIFGLTPSEIDAVRVDALNFYNTQFGVDISGAIVSPGFITTLPGIGNVLPLRFDVPFDLAAANPPLPCGTLQVAEFPLFFTSTTFEFGGVYGDYLTTTNKTKVVQPGDFLSFGLYLGNFTQNRDHDDDDHPFANRVWKIRTIVPTKMDLDGFTSERVVATDVEWGEASVFTDILSFTLPNGDILLKFRSAWRWPPGELLLGGF